MIIFVFIFGLIIGSFLNAVIWRLYSGKSIADGRSVCVHCKHELSAVDLIPLVSFIMLRGRCRYCAGKISWQYPLVEILTGLVFALFYAAASGQVSELLLFSLVCSCFLVVIAVFDLKHYLILDSVLIPAVVIAFLQLFYLSIVQKNFGFHSPVVSGILGAVIIASFFAAQYYISDGRWIGFGDVKLGIFLGLLFGFSQGLILLLVSYCLGAVIGLLLILFGGKNLTSKLPFGTILGFSAIIMMLYGTQILNWYLGIIGF
jgi:leader peptidase (prepilin peptidase)/N-methyltransferase